MMAKEGHVDYLLRNVEESLWRQVKSKAALGGIEVRKVIIEVLQNYIAGEMEKPKRKK